MEREIQTRLTYCLSSVGPWISRATKASSLIGPQRLSGHDASSGGPGAADRKGEHLLIMWVRQMAG